MSGYKKSYGHANWGPKGDLYWDHTLDDFSWRTIGCAADGSETEDNFIFDWMQAFAEIPDDCRLKVRAVGTSFITGYTGLGTGANPGPVWTDVFLRLYDLKNSVQLAITLPVKEARLWEFIVSGAAIQWPADDARMAVQVQALINDGSAPYPGGRMRLTAVSIEAVR